MISLVSYLTSVLNLEISDIIVLYNVLSNVFLIAIMFLIYKLCVAKKGLIKLWLFLLSFIGIMLAVNYCIIFEDDISTGTTVSKELFSVMEDIANVNSITLVIVILVFCITYSIHRIRVNFKKMQKARRRRQI